MTIDQLYIFVLCQTSPEIQSLNGIQQNRVDGRTQVDISLPQLVWNFHSETGRWIGTGERRLSSGYSEQDYSKLGLVLTIQSLHMPAKPRFINDKLEILVLKCIVFPADGSETRLVHMVARTVTVEDIPPLAGYSRCVDMASTFGDEYRKTQVLAYKISRDGVQSTYLFFYNLSPNLPINLSIARVIGVTPSHLKSRKRLFWRGDVVAMKVQPESESIVESLDADLFDLNPLEEFFRMRYQGGSLESFLDSLEQQCEQEFGQSVNRLKKACRGLLCFTLLWALFAAAWRPNDLLGFKRGRTGR